MPVIYLWQWFGEILSGCTATGFAPTGIGWRDLSDWCALTGSVLEPWEARALIMLSDLRFSILAEQKKKPGPN